MLATGSLQANVVGDATGVGDAMGEAAASGLGEAEGAGEAVLQALRTTSART